MQWAFMKGLQSFGNSLVHALVAGFYGNGLAVGARDGDFDPREGGVDATLDKHARTTLYRWY